MLMFTMLRGLCYGVMSYSSILVYFSPVPDYVRVTIDTVVAIHKQEPHGDVLAFLTGQVCLSMSPCNYHVLFVCVRVCVSAYICV